MSSATPAETVLPPGDPDTLGGLADFLTAHPGARLVADDGTSTDLTAQVYAVLGDVVQTLHSGRAVTIAPVSQRLTTSQAADLLGISRPTLVRLLEDGKIPFEKPRRHRLLRLDDVLAYKHASAARRRAVLDEMVRDAAADGLYDSGEETYREALRAARRH